MKEKEYIYKEDIRNKLYDADAITMYGVAIINDFPAADVREVVYCEDCDAYKQSNWIDKHMECARFKCPVSKKDFCSLAVKKEAQT